MYVLVSYRLDIDLRLQMIAGKSCHLNIATRLAARAVAGSTVIHCGLLCPPAEVQVLGVLPRLPGQAGAD